MLYEVITYNKVNDVVLPVRTENVKRLRFYEKMGGRFSVHLAVYIKLLRRLTADVYFAALKLFCHRYPFELAFF